MMEEDIRILIIDDDDNTRTTLSDLLGEHGYKVFESSNGEEAVEIVKKEKPNVVLLDTLMPGLDGYETCRRIKAIEGINTKVIMVTGNVDAVDAMKAKQAGADEYTVKTSGFGGLVSMTKEMIS